MFASRDSRATAEGAEIRVPKVLGADVELGNFVEGIDTADGTSRLASRMLLREIDGVAAEGRSTRSSSTWWREPDDGEFRTENLVNPQDWGRRFLPTNGGCAYIDLDHLELAQPETTNAFDSVVWGRAMLGVAARALEQANRRLSGGLRIVTIANTSDGLDHSYGAHVNVLVSRAAWDNICVRKPHHLAYLAAFQASSIVYTGAGKVGAENRRAPVPYQISQRADFIETIVGQQTTYDRPLVNARDEALCGSPSRNPSARSLARLHVIFYDHALAQTAVVLKAGTLQIVASMLEAGAVDASLALDDPLEALMVWGRDPGLTVRARTVGGDVLSAVDLQFRFLDEAKRFADRGELDGRVPRAAELLALWEDTLIKLQSRDFDALTRRLDWVLKQHLLKRAIARRPALDWASPQIKHLDQSYASLDPDEGLFWACERDGLVDRLVTDEAIARATLQPPDDTRAWTRAHVLRLAGPDGTEYVDWDSIRITLARRAGSVLWRAHRTIDLPHPAAATRAEHHALFDGAREIDAVVEALAQPEEQTPASVALAPIRSPRPVN